jgi:aminoglycoside phosphotransferase (APT) family kinase protein
METTATFQSAAVTALAGLSATGPIDLRTVSLSPGRAVFAASSVLKGVFIKVYDDAGPLSAEVCNLEVAARAGLPTPRALRFIDESTPAVLVMTAIAGRRIRASDPADTWRELGAVVRRIGKIEMPPDPSMPPWAALVVGRLRRELDQWVELELTTRDAAATLVDALEAMGPTLATRPLTFTHNDLQADHVLVDPSSGRLLGLVDFADARTADPLLDLAVVSMDDGAPTAELLAGFGDTGPHGEDLIPWYRLVKRIGAANWLQNQGLTERAHVEVAAGQKLVQAFLIGRHG